MNFQNVKQLQKLQYDKFFLLIGVFSSKPNPNAINCIWIGFAGEHTNEQEKFIIL